MRRRAVSAIAAAVATMVAASAAHATTWSSPTTISAAGEDAYIAPRIATDANGDMIAAWLKVTSFSGAWNCPCVVRAAYRPAGGTFGAPVDVSATMSNNDSAQQIFLAMSANGQAVVAWNGGQDPDHTTDYDTPYAAIRPAGASAGWGQPFTLDTPSGNNEDGVDVNALAMDAAGDAIAGLTGEQAFTGPGAIGGDQVGDAEVVTRPANGAFDTAHPQVLTDSTHWGYLRALAMSPNGHAVVAIRDDVFNEATPLVPQPNALETMTSLAPGAAFGGRQTIETVTATTFGGQPLVDAGDNLRPVAAIDDAGDYALEYSRDDPNGQPFSYNTTTKISVNGGSGISLNPVTATSAAPNGLVMDSTGAAVAFLDDTNANVTYESVRPAGGGFGAPTAIGNSIPAPTTVANAANETGAGSGVLYGFDGAGTNSDDVDATIGTIAGSLPAPTTIAAADDNFAFGAQGAIDQNGDAGLVWLGGTDGTQVRASLFGSGTPPAPATHTLTVATSGAGSGTVTSSPAGISCGSTCSHAYDAGTQVTLSAAASSGSKFTGWSGGGCTGAGVCKVTLSADAAVTATFSKSGGNGGTNPPNTVITKKKVNKHKHSVQFTFKATVAKATGFDCALVKAPKHTAKKRSAPAYKACSSPKTYKHLHGRYTFYVRARNAAGPDKTPATAKVKV